MSLWGSIHFHQRGQKMFPSKGLMTKGKLQRLLWFLLEAPLCLFNWFIKVNQKDACQSSHFSSIFMPHLSTNHWYNLEKCEYLLKVIILSHLSTKKKGLGYPKEQQSLIIMDTFKGQDNEGMKRLYLKNNCELVIVPHNLKNKFQPLDISINQSAKKFISNKFNAWYADTVVNCQMELQLAMLKYPSNWVIWNLFMLGGLLRYTII